MYLCLNKLASTAWRKSSPNFSIQCIKLEESRSHFPIHSWPFFVVSNATNFFHSLNRFVFSKKNAYVLLVFFIWVPYFQISYMIPGVNIIVRKVSIAGVNRAGEFGGCSGTPAGGFRGWSTLRKFLGSKEHLYRLKIDLKVAEIIIVQDYKHTKKLIWKYTCTALKLRVKQVIYESKIYWKILSCKIARDLKIWAFCLKIQQKASGPGESTAGVT